MGQCLPLYRRIGHGLSLDRWIGQLVEDCRIGNGLVEEWQWIDGIRLADLPRIGIGFLDW